MHRAMGIPGSLEVRRGSQDHEHLLAAHQAPPRGRLRGRLGAPGSRHGPRSPAAGRAPFASGRRHRREEDEPGASARQLGRPPWKPGSLLPRADRPDPRREGCGAQRCWQGSAVPPGFCDRFHGQLRAGNRGQEQAGEQGPADDVERIRQGEPPGHPSVRSAAEISFASWRIAPRAHVCATFAA